jgi:phosphatidylinositol alpha-1,6-mannosyltransferase
MDLTYALRQPRKKIIAKKILKKADKIICANSYTANLVKDFLGDGYKNKIAVVNPGIDPSEAKHDIKQVSQLKEKYNLYNKIILFSVGRLVKRKGFDMVIDALPDVLTKLPNLVYVIAGAGPDEDYLKQKSSSLEQSGLSNIIFLGKISDQEKWAWLNLCDIFIMPAKNINGDFEGFGIVYLEANLTSKPVIAGDSGGVSDAVEDHVNGILIDPESKDAVADGILELALDKRLRNSLGQQGWERAVREFNWDKQIRKIFYLVNQKESDTL